ncbi:MAG: type II secretion system F family protein [Planctomycetota bacterium]|jgi:type II secretory pathway component PulF
MNYELRKVRKMKSYRYVARDSAGARKKGLTEAISSNDVLNWLREQGLTPVSVSEIAADTAKSRRTTRRKRIKSGDLAALFWQLATMLEGGLPIIVALDTIAEDTEKLQLQRILQQLSDKVKKGQTLSRSVAEFPKVFNRLCCAIMLAGETSGNLADAMGKLAEYFDNRDKLVKKINSAMAYPIFVFSFIVLIVVFIMAFIIPRFRTIFSQMGGELPALTRGFMGFYDVLHYNLHYIIGSVVFLIVFTVLVSKTQKGHYLFSKIILGMPLLGKVFNQTFVAMFCKTMSTLLAAGASVLDALDILAGMTGNDVIKSAVIQTRENIVDGSNISLSMAAAGFFPNMVIKMVQVGEESGSLPRVLERASIHYERKVDSLITTMVGLLEPIMIVSVGAIVLVVVLALYMPIFTMSDITG